MKKIYPKPDIILTLLYLLIEIPYLGSLPDVMIDEPWYGNTAYNFVQTFYFTNTNVGMSGGDLFCFSNIMLSLFYALFGLSHIVSRLSSVAAGLIALIGLIRLLKQFKIKDTAIYCTGLLFICSNVIYIIARTTRPEIWVVALMIWSIFFAFRYKETLKNKDAFVSGIIAGFCFLSHPNGVLAIVNSGLILLIASIEKRKIKGLVFFILLSILSFGLPAAYCLSNPAYDLTSLMDEILSRNSVSTNTSIISNLFAFVSNYILGIKRLYILTFELGILVLGIIVLRKNTQLLLFPILGILNFVIDFTLFTPFITRTFGTIIVFTLITFALILTHANTNRSKQLILTLGLLYFINNFSGELYLFTMKSNNVSYNELTKNIDKYIPNDKSVVSILEFWYAFPENKFYSQWENWNMDEFKNIDALLKNGSIDYIVLSDYIVRGYTVTSERKETISDYIFNYYSVVNDYAQKNGLLIHEFDAKNYGTVKIWKLSN